VCGGGRVSGGGRGSQHGCHWEPLRQENTTPTYSTGCAASMPVYGLPYDDKTLFQGINVVLPAWLLLVSSYCCTLEGCPCAQHEQSRNRGRLFQAWADALVASPRPLRGPDLTRVDHGLKAKATVQLLERS
jgi:hypothetical protein